MIKKVFYIKIDTTLLLIIIISFIHTRKCSAENKSAKAKYEPTIGNGRGEGGRGFQGIESRDN